jgi:AraC family transcriptional regulator
MTVTEVRCDNPLPEMSGPVRQEDAFLVALYLRDAPNCEYWEDGRRASVCDQRIGESSLHDLKRDPRSLIDKPYHCLASICRVRRWMRSLTTPTRREFAI